LTPPLLRGSLGIGGFAMEKKRKIELMLQEIGNRGGLVHL
jgi:hypothetical protein